MATIEQQIALEQEMIAIGRERYQLAQEKHTENGRGSETDAARRLTREFIEPVALALTEWCGVKQAGRSGRVKPLLRLVDPLAAAYITLQQVFNSLDTTNLTSLGRRIGVMIEDEIRFNLFRMKHENYYDEIMMDFRRKGTKSYQHKHRVMTFKANEYEDGWEKWSHADQVAVGIKMLDFVLTTTNLIEKKTFYSGVNMHVEIVPTQETIEWMRDNMEIMAAIAPDRMPCIIPPDDWTERRQGGYYTPEMRSRVPLIVTKTKEHRRWLKGKDLKPITDAVNMIQRTPWAIDQRVLEVARIVWHNNLQIGMPATEPYKPDPSPVDGLPKDQLTPEQIEQFDDWKKQAALIYAKEKDRVAKTYQTSRILRLAARYSEYDRFWYVWYCDFRGRMYSATSGLSPQGSDVAKGLLKFADGVQLGDTGWYWLQVNLANRYGVDKVSYAERVEWVQNNSQHILDTARDPLSHRSFWGDADKPYQFLAACFEYADAVLHHKVHGTYSTFVTHIPVGLDGSCNGLQNFSAMLRDEVGGRATNLCFGTKPEDIYAQVAEVCTRKLRSLLSKLEADDPDYDTVERWVRFADLHGRGTIPRDMSKRPVMTLPYGATQNSCTSYIYQSLMDHDPKLFERPYHASAFLTPYLWNSIGEVVVAARAAMGWLQKCSSAISKSEQPITWLTPDGFPVFQLTYEQEDIRVRTQLAGDFRLRLRVDTDKIYKRGQYNAIAPNFVHSMDATHLREVVRLCNEVGVTALATVHDDIGTHAGNVAVLHKAIRQAFFGLYSQSDPLQDFKDQQEYLGHDIPDLPNKGTLDLNQVMLSPYFFG